LKGKFNLNEELKKLGLRVRPRTVANAAREARKPGHIAFDDRGNAVYEWNEELAADDAETARRRALAHPGLALVHEDPPPNAPIRNNVHGLRLGYNPYESGLLPKKPLRKKRDLRELSKWIETRRRLQRGE
jgi:hypothetical protein